MLDAQPTEGSGLGRIVWRRPMGSILALSQVATGKSLGTWLLLDAYLAMATRALEVAVRTAIPIPVFVDIRR